MGTWRQWRGHSIGHNKKCRRPSLFCFVDTETQKRPKPPYRSYDENELRMGMACFVEWRRNREPKETWWTFDKATGFWDGLYKLLKPRRCAWLVAHNVLFDCTMLEMWTRLEGGELCQTAKQLESRGHSATRLGLREDWRGMTAIDGSPFHMELVHANGRLNVTDLMNYYPCSLETIGESVGIAKRARPDMSASEEDWLTYCKQDVQILKTAYLNLVGQWETEDNGNWQMSAASLAWSSYRHNRNCSDIIVHCHRNARDLEWQSYYGGECRAWYRGLSPGGVVNLDVNSLYPAVMASNLYPIELIDYIVTPHRGIVESLLKRYAVIADVTMDNLWDDIPTRHNGKIVYPVGYFRTQLAGPELAACLRGGCVHTIHAIAYYKQRDIFSDYVKRWYDVKSGAVRSGKVAEALLAKIMLNGLQGKFAQRSKVWESDDAVECLRPWSVWPHKDAETGTMVSVRSIGWNAQVARNRKECAHTFPAVAAHITSYARQRMQFLRKDIPPSCLYYQDTDSLMVDWQWFRSEGERILPIGTELGQLRVLGEYKSVEFRGPKNYTADGRHCISGIRKKDSQIGASTFVCERMERTASVIGREPDGIVRSWERCVEVPGTCREGGYRPDGWSFPICLGLTKSVSADRLMA